MYICVGARYKYVILQMINMIYKCIIICEFNILHLFLKYDITGFVFWIKKKYINIINILLNYNFKDIDVNTYIYIVKNKYCRCQK